MQLEQLIPQHAARSREQLNEESREVFGCFIEKLNAGQVRRLKKSMAAGG